MGRKPSIYISLILLLVTISVFTGCKKDEYYERPASLEPTIYTQLTNRGNFKSYLTCVDRAGYKDVLDRAGYFTVFAPTDEAFQSFLTTSNNSSVNELDSNIVKQIVAYSIVYNAYSQDQLDDYQSTDSSSWISNQAFKRRTAYYKWVYKTTVDGEEKYVVDMNAVGSEESPSSFHRYEDYNNKHIPYFTQDFLDLKGLSSADYEYFYEGTGFSGFNVVDAVVTEVDNFAENGVYHVVDKVILPLESIEEIINSNSQYSEVKKLMDKYIVDYSLAGNGVHYLYELATGNRPEIYVKEYPGLNFAPGCENYLRYGLGEQYDAQRNGWTMFMPTNEAFKTFKNEKLLSHYSSIDSLPNVVITEFINAHMFRTSVWPSKFKITLNPFGEEARFDAYSNDVVEKRIASNGLFYGVSKVQETDAFYTLMGDIFLDPNYTSMLQALYSTNLYAIIKNNKFKLTVFMIRNEAFDKLGLTFNENLNTWELNSTLIDGNAFNTLNRIINSHIVINKEIEDFSGSGYVQTYGGEYLRYNAGQIWAPGNLHYNGGGVAVPTNPRDINIRSNGISYVLGDDDILLYTTNNIGYDLNEIGGKFYDYLEKAGNNLPGFLYDVTTQEITNLSIATPHTVLVPVDSAIDGAVRDGYLPAITDLSFTQDELDMVARFIWFHCIKGVVFVPEEPISGEASTLYKTVDGSTYVTVNNEGGQIQVFDKKGNTAKVLDPTNLVLTKMSNNAIIHTVDNYLRY